MIPGNHGRVALSEKTEMDGTGVSPVLAEPSEVVLPKSIPISHAEHNPTQGAVFFDQYQQTKFYLPTEFVFDSSAKPFSFTISDGAENAITLEADIYGLTLVEQVDYTYDAFNQLVHRQHDSDGPGSAPATDAFFSYEGGQVVMDFSSGSATAPAHRYLWNPAAVDQLLADEVVTSSSAGEIFWPLANHLGTIFDIASHDSITHETEIENHRVYDSWGRLISETDDTVDMVFGFTGRLWDEATDLQNNLNRWYNPQTGRWISEDPIGFAGDPSNLYRYVENNPLINVDPTGLVGHVVIAGSNPAGAAVAIGWGCGWLGYRIVTKPLLEPCLTRLWYRLRPVNSDPPLKKCYEYFNACQLAAIDERLACDRDGRPSWECSAQFNRRMKACDDGLDACKKKIFQGLTR